WNKLLDGMRGLACNIYGAAEDHRAKSIAGAQRQLVRVLDLPEVAESVAFAFLSGAGWDVLNKARELTGAMVMLPWVAKVAAEDFFPPQELVAVLRPPWEPSATIRLLDIQRATGAWTKPTVRHETAPLGRNERCACGSGKKYK